MFTKEIMGLTLTNQIADGLFPNINGVNFRNDRSFLATLRALMYKRVPSGESIYLAVTNSQYTAGEIKGAAPKDCVRAFLRNSRILIDDREGTGVLNIHSFDGTEENNTACFNHLDSGALNELVGGYTALNDVDKWLEQNGKVRARVYLNSEKKNTLIFIERLDVKRWHLLQSLIPRYFPWYVADNPFDEEEIALIKSLTKRYAPEYEEKMEAFAKRFDFRSAHVRNMLSGFETAFEKKELENVRRRIQQLKNNIESYRTEIARFFRDLQDTAIKELGLITKINQEEKEDSELLEYFLCNKSLNIIDVSGATIEFVVTTTISNFDPDMAESAIGRVGKSFFYRHYETRNRYKNKELTDERLYLLMKAIFIDETMKLRVCSAYRLNFADGTYYGLSGYSYPDEILKSHTPNQHIHHYACLGNNRPIIERAMLDRDYITAVSQCCSSAANMNLSESNTGTYFMEYICDKDVGQIIQMPDGSTATPLDAAKWLEEQNEAKKETKEEENG